MCITGAHFLILSKSNRSWCPPSLNIHLGYMTQCIHLQPSVWIYPSQLCRVHSNSLPENTSSLTIVFPTVDIFHFCTEHSNEHTTNHGKFSNNSQIDSYCCFEVVIKELCDTCQTKMKKPSEDTCTHLHKTEDTNQIMQSYFVLNMASWLRHLLVKSD